MNIYKAHNKKKKKNTSTAAEVEICQDSRVTARLERYHL